MNFATLKGLTIPKVPDGYTQLQYIESTGTQYIDTGVIGRAGIATALDFTIISGNLDDFIPMGCVLPNWTPRCYLAALQNGAFWSYALGEWQFSNTSASVGVRYLVETSLGSNLQTMKVNGTTVKNSADLSSVDTGLSVYLFGNNYSNSYIAYGAMRVYSCKIYEGDALARDFVPCKNASGEAGLYDLVNDTFYANAGTGEFIAGATAGSVVTQITDASGNVLWSAGGIQPKEFLTFSSDDQFTLSVPYAKWDGTMYYSLDTKNWSEWDGSAISSNNIYLCGVGNTKVIGQRSTMYKWTLTGAGISCSGNIEILLDYPSVEAGEHPVMAPQCYAYMFYECTGLTTAPALPATTLADRCYYNMFNNCTSLTTAPALPATTLAKDCYSAMFSRCTGLTTAPALPATTLAEDCYAGMFTRCTGLTTAPALPATTLAEGCYSNMFKNCTSITTAPALPATTLAEACYHSMFYGCAGLTTAPALPATTLADRCYYNMFSRCTGLTTAPALPATTLAEDCYYSMFYGCAGLKLSETRTEEYQIAYRIPINGEGITESNALNDMFAYTGGSYVGTPYINTTYYLHSSNTIVL